MPLVYQAVGHEPGMYLVVMAGLRNFRMVSVPFKGDGSLFIKLDLNNPTGSMHLARKPSAPTGSSYRLYLAWAGVSKDGERIEGSAKSWVQYVIGYV